jgi:O-succinylbenzoic acid--CoA ligase
MIPTGGTSGKIRFAIHTWETLSDSVWGVQTYFEVDSINSCCVLPLYHVSGLMQMMRSLLTGGKLAIVPPKNQDSQDRNQSLEQILGEINPSDFFLSLVPTQLQRFLQSPPMIVQLAQLQTILLGGAPAWPELLTQSRYANLHLAPTYGMTETASQVVTLKPSDFLQRRTGCGQVLPHAKILILEANEDGVGAIAIQSKSLALGYYPDLFTETRFITDDLGYFDEQGYLHIVGRNSQKIITGGENVFPSEVESAILASGYVKDVSVVGIPDSQWGEVVAAVYVAIAPNLPRFSPTDSNLEIPPFQAEIQAAIQTTLSRYKQPKIWRCVDSIPRNAQGKINQITIRQLLGF